jgi:DNA-binding NtrC family response regulator
MKKKILVVDDEKSICLLLENFLSQDYDVVSMDDGLEALKWLDENLPDLIISDRRHLNFYNKKSNSKVVI